jgi:hypothetical protein
MEDVQHVASCLPECLLAEHVVPKLLRTDLYRRTPDVVRDALNLCLVSKRSSSSGPRFLGLQMLDALDPGCIAVAEGRRCMAIEQMRHLMKRPLRNTSKQEVWSLYAQLSGDRRCTSYLSKRRMLLLIASTASSATGDGRCLSAAFRTRLVAVRWMKVDVELAERRFLLSEAEIQEVQKLPCRNLQSQPRSNLLARRRVCLAHVIEAAKAKHGPEPQGLLVTLERRLRGLSDKRRGILRTLEEHEGMQLLLRHVPMAREMWTEAWNSPCPNYVYVVTIQLARWAEEVLVISRRSPVPLDGRSLSFVCIGVYSGGICTHSLVVTLQQKWRLDRFLEEISPSAGGLIPEEEARSACGRESPPVFVSCVLEWLRRHHGCDPSMLPEEFLEDY